VLGDGEEEVAEEDAEDGDASGCGAEMSGGGGGNARRPAGWSTAGTGSRGGGGNSAAFISSSSPLSLFCYLCFRFLLYPRLFISQIVEFSNFSFYSFLKITTNE
jgi:hypothetical protein